MSAFRGILSGVLAVFFLGIPVQAQGGADGQDDTGFRFGLGVKAHYRDSDQARFPSPFPFGDGARPPGGGPVFLETVEAGEHTEISVVTLWLAADWAHDLSAKLKVDLIDRYDRNPTSEDDEFDIDEAWLRWGNEVEPGQIGEGFGVYAKLGKIPKFERQDDRHLESYGLVSTAFNRFEDIGLELGFDFGKHLYMKASYTQGNPVFIRDPNALAGDNGIDLLNTTNPDPELKSGIVILYETDSDDVNFDEPEVGLGAGLRFGDESGFAAVDILGWAYERDLAETVELDGTFYGGDLDLLRGPSNNPLFSLPGISGREKQEMGANLWVYLGDFTFFGQYVDQELAGIERTGYEVEASWAFELPFLGDLWGRQILPYIAPAVRYSELDPDIVIIPGEFKFPAVSVAWDWEKIDLGIRLGLLNGLDLTLEWNDNNFIRAGVEESADEFLATVNFEIDWGI